MIDRKQVIKELNKVVDPEIGIPITDMELVDEIKIDKEKGDVTIQFHFTTPNCPPVFAFKIALDIRHLISQLSGVKTVKVLLKDHVMAEQINKEINKSIDF